MKVKIHFTINEYKDDFTVDGDTFTEVKRKVDSFFKSRGIDQDKCSPWSEEIREDK